MRNMFLQKDGDSIFWKKDDNNNNNNNITNKASYILASVFLFHQRGLNSLNLIDSGKDF